MSSFLYLIIWGATALYNMLFATENQKSLPEPLIFQVIQHPCPDPSGDMPECQEMSDFTLNSSTSLIDVFKFLILKILAFRANFCCGLLSLAGYF